MMALAAGREEVAAAQSAATAVGAAVCAAAFLAACFTLPKYCGAIRNGHSVRRSSKGRCCSVACQAEMGWAVTENNPPWRSGERLTATLRHNIFVLWAQRRVGAAGFQLKLCGLGQGPSPPSPRARQHQQKEGRRMAECAKSVGQVVTDPMASPARHLLGRSVNRFKCEAP